MPRTSRPARTSHTRCGPSPTPRRKQCALPTTGCEKALARTCNCCLSIHGQRLCACSRCQRRSGSMVGLSPKAPCSPRSIGLSRPATLAPAPTHHHRPIGGDELDRLADHDRLPAALMDQAMVVVAEGDHLVDVGPTAVFPEFDVMRLGPARRPIASRPRAGLVLRFE